MYILYMLGRVLEPGIGTPRFLAVYFASLFAGSLGAILLSGPVGSRWGRRARSSGSSAPPS